MGFGTTAAALLLLSGVRVTFAAVPVSACELMPAAVLSTLAGTPLHIDSDALNGAESVRSTCTYAGRGRTFVLSVSALPSESAARRAFTEELARVAGGPLPAEPLRGVGVEARFRPAGRGIEAAIIARHAGVVFVMRGQAGQDVLVAAARAIVARLERQALDPVRQTPP